MSDENRKKTARITFHNPNTPEETVKLMVKIVAWNMFDYISDKANVSTPLQS